MIALQTSALLAAVMLGGCGTGPGPRAIGPEDFYTRRVVSEAPLSPTDKPGAVIERGTQSEPAAPPPAGVAHGEVISPSVRDVVTATTLPDFQSATTQPFDPGLQQALQSHGLPPATSPSDAATTEPVFQQNQFMILGIVVADVQGKPIYANKLLQLDGLRLRTMARQYNEQQFQIAARVLLERSTSVLIYDELEVAAAERTLDAKDRDYARALTSRWSQRQITEAGGSVELAKRKFEAEGKDFQDAENDQYRSFLTQLYYVRKIEPRIGVTAADEREYYLSHLKSDYSRPEKIYFRMIMCNPAVHPQDDARKRMEDLRAKIIGGADFTALASDSGNNDLNADKGGMVEVARGSFALAKVEEAAWKLKPGEVSPVIEDNGSFFLVKMINTEPGGTQPFDDVKVQEDIFNKLHSKQVFDLRRAEQDKLRASAIVRFEPAMLDPVVAMAMQNYARWAKTK